MKQNNFPTPPRKWPVRDRLPAWFAIVFTLFCSPPTSLQAGEYGDLLLFPVVRAEHRNGLKPGTEFEDDEFTAGIDIFYTTVRGKFQALGEVFLDDEEQELERLQLGWRVQPDTVLWAGRFHNPLGYWNTQYHHGPYLQTAIARPGIAEFEDEGGLLPLNLTGLMLQTDQQLGPGSLSLDMLVGAGPELDGDELKPLDLLKPRDRSNEPGATVRVTLQPDDRKFLKFGFLAGFTEIPVKRGTLEKVDQVQLGVYGVVETGAIQAFGALFYIHDELEFASSTDSGSFVNGYAQLEYRLRNKWITYGRVENSLGEGDDPYASLFPSFVRKRWLGGIRYDILRHHALTLEVSDVSVKTHSFQAVKIQWSAVF